MKNIIITTASSLAIAASFAVAGESVAPAKGGIAPTPLPTSAGDFFLGANAREDAWYGYAGVNYAFNGDIDSSGFIAQAVAGYGEYDYATAFGGVDGEVSDYEFSLGYKAVTDSFDITVLGGVHITDHELSGAAADIAANSVRGDETGFKAKLDIWSNHSADYFYGGTFTYSTAFDSQWHRVVFAKNFGGFNLGPEVIYLANEEFSEVRAGLTLGGLRFANADVSASLGYSWADPEQGTNDQEGIYGGIHFNFEF